MTTTKSEDPLIARARALKLYGLLSHWDEIAQAAILNVASQPDHLQLFGGRKWAIESAKGSNNDQKNREIGINTVMTNNCEVES